MGRASSPSPRTPPERHPRRVPRERALPTAAFVLAGLVPLLCPTAAGAVQVRGLSAAHRHGQTFLAWVSPPGTGWTYRIYRSSSPIRGNPDLAATSLAGSVGDSTWCDRRLSSLRGETYAYRTDSLAKPLLDWQGLFVFTVPDAGAHYYAVTCQESGGAEDGHVTPGKNALDLAVAEAPGLPRPVYQRTIMQDGLTVDVYTLWTSDRGTAVFPAMSNRPSTPYDCAVLRGGPGPSNALMFEPHPRNAGFLRTSGGSGMPGEWVITMDDFVRTPEVNTFWFGYHEAYDIQSDANLAPLAGTVHDYTLRRVVFTLEWALQNFPVDPTRVYVFGTSMGGICGALLSMARPDLIAAVMLNVPRFDFSFEADPNPLSAFNQGGGQRATCDRLWGTVDTDLRMADGTPVFERLNAGALARTLEARFVPPIIAFNGRNDYIVGWAEKIPFYRAMREHRAGGTFFWDTRSHTTSQVAAWFPLQDPRYLYRFKTDRSFPALSNCSADFNPGNGDAADGDSVGTINGLVEWDATVTDVPTRWRVRLTPRDLPSRWGVVPAPESLTVDVTPRRLQSFVVTPGADYLWFNTRGSDGTVVGTGVVRPDALGLLTVPAVRVYRGGSFLELKPAAYLDAGFGSWLPAGGPPAIAPLPSPVRGSCALTVTWPREGEATLDLLDLAGRRLRRLDAARVGPGPRTVRVDLAGLPSGIFFVAARQGGATAVRRVALVR